ncbi:enoyl-ACP reductase FabV [Aeromonas caviae]|uniref:Enoyl-[acyl-carrier-protein] reductase [NADH] n=1 Tax=Aeromonas caviae TaxID=648 RepID=A0AAV4YJE7_AERCA|nr:enoyl-ACP reductase FabV [Aeromonas caviae]BDN90497.1 enoyl-[acyl-carrier-protein] reductase [NADH] [Aeromonas caviae]GJA15779.1 enoyl-[acyl-carrier-protein] reductase [NADH] [Aeromonas caviae]GJA24307.1 enoyl-[acyl-carrier-protein] reductase [NADH] [Aeromonas caviae]GJA31317.1 enoyl-[acyl-carrier-protein] reductase [NADH] [Aeromonas caviae]GJA35605.1 enoyl-[acyl-carrier-protein] reductase [NADH] [Aeromonas caviae]
MIIHPQIQGCVARNCHPMGCRAAVLQQIEQVRAAGPFNGPKRVLVLGASSGFGLASRIALTFGAGADTLGVSFERGPSDKGLGSAGWYNNIWFRQAAEQAGRIAVNLIGDAFSGTMRQQAIDVIRQRLGQVDLVVYSLASGVRVMPDGTQVRSVLKTTGQPLQGWGLDLEHDALVQQSLVPATPEEIRDTVTVMGGEDWQRWMQALQQADCLAPGARTVAYSYIGPESTYPLYRDGTIGYAKEHLHATAETINLQLAGIGGHAWVSVCKALVTKASVFIPVLPVYLGLLMGVMKERGVHEGCIEQMQRLFADKMYGPRGVVADGNRLIRMDDHELEPAVQAAVSALWPKVTPENFRTLGDFAGLRQEFMLLNGFELPGVDYGAPVNVASLTELTP